MSGKTPPDHIAAAMASLRKRSALWVGVLVALVLSQWLGVLHAGMQVQPGHTAHAHGMAMGSPAQPHGHGVADILVGLFSDHGSVADCRLYDQISHGDCATTSAPTDLLSVQWPITTSRVAAGLSGATRAWIQARGPPFLQ